MRRILLLPFFLFFLFPVSYSFSQDVQNKNNEAKKYNGAASQKLASGSDLTIDEIKQLVEDGADVNATDNNGNTALHWSCNGHRFSLEKVKYLVAKGANVNAKVPSSGWTPLHYAVRNDALRVKPDGSPDDPKKVSEIIKFLVNNGADLFAPERSQATPIGIYLQRMGANLDVDLVKALLNKKNINNQDSSGGTPLTYAISAKVDFDVIKYMCEDCNADVKLGNNSGVTPIHIAVRQPNAKVISLLISKGADINEQNRSGKSALHLLIESNAQKDILKEIITQNKIDIANAYKGVDSPIHTGMRQPDRIKYFLDLGISINSRNKANRTPLHIAATVPQQIEHFNYLINNGADINAEDDDGRTPLHHAAATPTDTTNIIERLIDKKANINAKNNDGQTPLLELLKSSKPQHIKFNLFKLLVDKNAEVNITDKNLSTPLHIVLASQTPLDIDVVQLLLEKGVNVNARNNDGQTALAVYLKRLLPPPNQQQPAVTNGGCNVLLKFLIDRGADIRIKDKNNTTVFEMIVKINLRIEKDILKKLVECGKDIDWSKDKISSPVCWALTNNADLDVLDYFSKNKADFKKKDASGVSPLMNLIVNEIQNSNRISLEKVKFLVERGVEMNDTASRQTPLLYVLTLGKPDFEIVKYLVENGADVHAKQSSNYGGFGVLHAAIMANFTNRDNATDDLNQNFFEIVKYLVEHGADVNSPSNNEKSTRPIHLAALLGSEKIVKYLVEQGADLSAKTSQDENPLHLALGGFAKIDLVKFMIQNGCSVNDKDNDGTTPFIRATDNFYIGLDILKYLCEEANADIHVRDNDGNTPLISSVKYAKNAEKIKYLIERGADVKAVDSNGRNLIHCLLTTHSYRRGFRYHTPRAGQMDAKNMCELISTFIDKGVDKNGVNNHGMTPLTYAIHSTQSDDTLKDMIKLFNVDFADRKYKTFFHEFLRSDNNSNDNFLRRVKLLIQSGCPINAQDRFGATPLHIAAAKRAGLSVVQCLIDNGADVNAKDNNDATPLHIAVVKNAGSSVVQCLIDNGADVNAKDNNNVTPLHDASERCADTEVLNILIKAGADVNAKDIFGMTPLDIVGTEHRNIKETILKNEIKNKE
ncbi:MAG: ankyrin repeat domain-containing protein [Planctomycetaceae bacterium]|jgi:ankyrin repeat protein|nr:ankyrin repeat domain-containing protein [Planctomycetaceae bacterium]